MMAGTALAGPVTFAQVGESSSGNGVVWTNDGTGSATLNTARAGGDQVTFTFTRQAGVGPELSGPLQAVETINGGAGVTTTAQATGVFGLDTQPINAAMTISYRLATPIDGQTNLLTITITPTSAGSIGMVFAGQNGGSGASSSTSLPTVPPASYTMAFSSAFLDFAPGESISAGYSYSSLDPMMLIGADGLLNDFTAQDTATFSAYILSQPVREPASLGMLAVGLIGLCALRRGRRPA